MAPIPVLLRPVLGLIGEGATAADITERMQTLGIDLQDGLAAAVLTEAAALGLVRVATVDAGGRRHVLTSLGQRIASDDALGPDEADRLRDLEALRTDLSATIAHELRTPLTAIRTCAALLLSEDARPTAEQYRTLVDTIERNAERMQRVVGDILDLARFRAGSIALQRRRFDPRDLAAAAIASLRPVAQQRDVSIELEGATGGQAVYGDRRRLEQALINLVSNAVRFSPTGGQVQVEVTKRDGLQCWRVRDTGPGIAPEDRARLFERFFVGRSDRGGPRDGVGLGLPTALAIANAHGGRIDVESEVGGGSTFTLAVPIDGPDVDDPGGD